jgi:hypothetical protein
MDLKVAAAVHTLIEAVREGAGSKYRSRGRERRRD